MTKTLKALLSAHPDSAPAIGSPGQRWLTYGDLRGLANDVSEFLNRHGIGSRDRIAIVLPNGPDMASAFITIGQACATAPLNPAYRAEEFEFYLKDLAARAIVVEDGYNGPALDAVRALEIKVIRLSRSSGQPAGKFELTAEFQASATKIERPSPEDIALILHTSGTTSRPKVVPLSQANLFASANNIVESLDLTPADRCLNVMPLFHIHGLIAAVTASLAAGAQISCTAGFNALKFFAQLEEVDPTWYTAVPTMHQAILSRAKRNSEIINNNRLRFIRSSSASLPGPVMEELATTFKAPVIEAYGMTEATHQMCCNPFGENAQKPGSVGKAAGPLVQIAHEAESRLIDSNTTGEIVISGPNVTLGYEANPKANKENFFDFEGNRWFRTGDQGAFDQDGFLHLTGRLKEIINRGGEKISPLEVDAILLSHPEISQAVCFAAPHAKLGEDVMAAVVLADGSELSEGEIRQFAGGKLADFKVPRKVLVLDEIPKGSTGKVQRIGLAKSLGIAGA
jgi:acyl-CoA synthetase (AMP-forming)/AMP-acid ligase II